MKTLNSATKKVNRGTFNPKTDWKYPRKMLENLVEKGWQKCIDMRIPNPDTHKEKKKRRGFRTETIQFNSHTTLISRDLQKSEGSREFSSRRHCVGCTSNHTPAAKNVEQCKKQIRNKKNITCITVTPASFLYSLYSDFIRKKRRKMKG